MTLAAVSVLIAVLVLAVILILIVAVLIVILVLIVVLVAVLILVAVLVLILVIHSHFLQIILAGNRNDRLPRFSGFILCIEKNTSQQTG